MNKISYPVPVGYVTNVNHHTFLRRMNALMFTQYTILYLTYAVYLNFFAPSPLPPGPRKTAFVFSTTVVKVVYSAKAKAAADHSTIMS